MTGAARPAARVRMAHAAMMPVNLASRSGVLDKLSVTDEMSTTKHIDAVLEVGWGGVGEYYVRSGVAESECARLCVATGLLLCVNGSVENGGFEQQNKLMEAKGTWHSQQWRCMVSRTRTHTHWGCHWELLTSSHQRSSSLLEILDSLSRSLLVFFPTSFLLVFSPPPIS